MTQDTQAGAGAQPAPAQQPEALRLAEFLEARQTRLGSWRGSCDEYDRQAWDDYIKAWELLRSQHAPIAELEALQAAPPAPAAVAVPESHTQALKAIAEWPVTDMLLNMDAANMRGIAQRALAAAPAQPAAWMTPEGDRVVTETTMASARKDGGAMLSSLRPFTVALARVSAPAQAWPSECDSPELCRVHGGCAGQYGTKKTCPSFAVLNPCNPAAPAQEDARDLEAEALRACRDLPEGWEIEIHLERGYGVVTVIDPQGNDDELPVEGTLFDALKETIDTAIRDDAARAAQGGA